LLRILYYLSMNKNVNTILNNELSHNLRIDKNDFINNKLSSKIQRQVNFLNLI
jgi:hypothetical protein